MTALREHGDMAMTTKSAKTTKAAGETAGETEAAAATGGNKAAPGGTKAKPAKTPRESRKPRQRPAVADGAANTERKTRNDTKQAQLIAMLRRKEGATIAQIVAATGWQPHTVRGAFAGALKKKLGLEVTSEKVEGRGRVYRLPPA